MIWFIISRTRGGPIQSENKVAPKGTFENPDELKEVQETLLSLKTVEDSVEEKMHRVKDTLTKISQEIKDSWKSQVTEDLLLGK